MQATSTGNRFQANKTSFFSTLAEALDYAAQGQTGYNFYSGKGKLITALPYDTLRSEAKILAKKFNHLGVTRGARMALVANTHPDFVRFFFACQYAGITPVPLPAQIQLGGHNAYVTQLARLLSICRPDLAMATEDFFPFLTEAAEKLNFLFLGSPKDYDSLPEADTPPHPVEPTDLAYLQYTSGSTRFPRGVMITQRAVLNNLSAIIKQGLRIRPGDRAVSWLPFFHDMGLVGLLLAPMACQISVDYLSTRDFAMRPRLWLKLMSENRATISFSPPFGYDLVSRCLRDNEPQPYDLSAWRVAGVGAEMIRTESLETFAHILKHCGFTARSFLPCYGMAECSLAVCFGELGNGVQVDCVDANLLANQNRAIPVAATKDNHEGRFNTFVNCGEPLPGYEISVRDPNGQALPERHCGELFLRGPSVMSGYFGDLKATQDVLSRDNWLNTGDKAYKIGDCVVITGRQKDLIIINGRNIWPQDIEFLVESHPEIRTMDALAFSVPGPKGEEVAVIMIQCRLTDPQKRADLVDYVRRLVREELGIDSLIELVPRNTIPRTTSGKPSRSGARKEYLKRFAENQVDGCDEKRRAEAC
ncbi:MAG: fatty acyl-AMP ligase [Desulfobacterales bacterium]|jgi:fatty-acyl-CoA synthase|nr:fatty acyl-AMP ligase [Desulfobacterales bacterium]